MGKIVKLKNKKTGVRVYPVTATSAVVDADSGERLNDTLQNKVEEAPMDGAQYVRKNGTWAIAEVSMDSNEICRINLKSNQGDADNSSLNGATVNVVNTVTSEVIYDGVWDGTEIQLSIPGATIYKVTVGDVADYKTPDAITIEATAFSSRDLIMTYQTEVVSVTLSSDNGVSVVGQIVTINGVQHTWDGTAITQKVAFGVSYSVSVDYKKGYITPSIQTLNAGEVKRDVRIEYTEIGIGVYIQGVTGRLYTIEEWNSQEQLNGIAILTENCRFVMSVEDASDSVAWGDTGILINNITTTDDLSQAISDYNGESNTTEIISQLGVSGAISANYCRNYIFPDGSIGYMGSAGEWMAVIDNIEIIKEALNKCGASELRPYWTSTQSDKESVWIAHLYNKELLGSYPKNNEGWTWYNRALAKYSEN